MEFSGVVVAQGCPLDFEVARVVRGPNYEQKYRLKVEYRADVQDWEQIEYVGNETAIVAVEERIKGLADLLVHRMVEAGLPR